MATEHVVTTCVHSCQGHPKTTPDGHSSLQFGPHVTIHLDKEEKVEPLNFQNKMHRRNKQKKMCYLSRALQVLSGHRQGGDEHGDTAQHEHSPHQAAQASQQDGPRTNTENSQNMFLNEISKAAASLCLCERLLPVFMEQQNQQPDVTEDHSTCFSHGKGPWYSRHAV